MDVSSVSPERAQRWFVAGLLVIFVGLSVQYSVKVLSPRDGEFTRSAILRWTPQLLGLEEGENINLLYNYPNPPIMALILWPLAKLPTLATALVWFYLKVGMALLAFAWTFRMVESPDRPFPVWAKLATVALGLRPILSDLSHGNVNILILFLVVAALYAFHRRCDFLAGVVLALAIACKLTPALFVGYFLWKGAWRVLLGTAAGLLLFFLAVPGLVLGFAYNWQLLTTWVEVMVMPYVAGGVVTSEHPNQSLPGLAVRLFTRAPSVTDWVNGEYVPLAYHNLADIGARSAQWVVKGFMALFALLVVWTCRAPIAGRGTRLNWRLAAEFSLVVLGMLLFSERTWKHHAVTLLLPYAVLCYAVAALPLGVGLRRALVGLTALSVVCIASTSNGLLSHEHAELAQVYGGFTWAFVVLVVALAALLRLGPREGEK